MQNFLATCFLDPANRKRAKNALKTQKKLNPLAKNKMPFAAFGKIEDFLIKYQSYVSASSMHFRPHPYMLNSGLNPYMRNLGIFPYMRNLGLNLAFCGLKNYQISPFYVTKLPNEYFSPFTKTPLFSKLVPKHGNCKN